MQDATQDQPRWMTWTGWGLSGLVIAFLIFDGAIKVANLEIVRQTLADLGYPPGLALALGLITLVPSLLYAWPRTSLLGAILLTGLMGGAMATHLRVGSPVFSHLLFGLYLGLLVWGGLWFRSPMLRALLPVKRE